MRVDDWNFELLFDFFVEKSVLHLLVRHRDQVAFVSEHLQQQTAIGGGAVLLELLELFLQKGGCCTPSVSETW